MAKISETELFYPLARYYGSQGYIVNTEVENKYGYKRADIILTKDNSEITIGIETKTSLSFELLDQGNYWKKYTDYNYVCVPAIKGKRPDIVNTIINNLGFGMIEIDLKRYHRFYDSIEDKQSVIVDDDGHADLWKLGITFTATPKLNNPQTRNKNALRSVIYEEHQMWAVGGQQASNNYVSGYKLVMYDVYKYLRQELAEHPDSDGWMSLDDLVYQIENHSSTVVRNHYKDTKNGLRQAFKKFEAGDIQHVNTGRKTEYRIMDGSTKYQEMNKRESRT